MMFASLARLIIVAGALLVGLSLFVSMAHAHERIGTFSHAVVTVSADRVSYYLNLPPVTSNLLRNNIGERDDDIADYFHSELIIMSAGQECRLMQLLQVPPFPSGNRIIDMQFRCPAAVSDLTITSVLFLDLDESHTQFLRLAPPDDPGNVQHEAVLTASNQTFHVDNVEVAGTPWLERALAFLKLGVEHLITGIDHILFLLSVIIGLRFMESIKAVTSFTVAHSITMALAFLGAISLPASIVEPLIAVTVIYVAIENIVRKTIPRRWVWTFVFGLIHGLGFVGALKLVTVSQSELILSLVSFNIGIELGQIAVVAVAMLLFKLIHRFSWRIWFDRAFSGGVALLGVFWLGQRLLV